MPGDGCSLLRFTLFIIAVVLAIEVSFFINSVFSSHNINLSGHGVEDHIYAYNRPQCIFNTNFFFFFWYTFHYSLFAQI